MFQKYIGVDYSGAGDPNRSNPHLAVAIADQVMPVPIIKHQIIDGKIINWSRKDLYHYLLQELLTSKERVAIGMDLGFSYPISILKELQLTNWDSFLDWIVEVWDTENYSLADCKKNVDYKNSTLKRLVEEQYTASAKSVVDLDRKQGMQGAVSYSSHTGLPWIYKLRKLKHANQIKLHFWPFDGLEIAEDYHVIFEAYPTLYKKRVICESSEKSLNEHERDAYAIASWVRDRDINQVLSPYLSLETLTPSELSLVKLEGWILGCL